ncbi:hypothetical protein C8J57DRAFT_1274421 [Mycena rebaudengoi]|nr:hypothetical protein C8J57DRAFT_1274421 [Mycena rebaudengoi]
MRFLFVCLLRADCRANAPKWHGPDIMFFPLLLWSAFIDMRYSARTLTAPRACIRSQICAKRWPARHTRSGGVHCGLCMGRYVPHLGRCARVSFLGVAWVRSFLVACDLCCPPPTHHAHPCGYGGVLRGCRAFTRQRAPDLRAHVFSPAARRSCGCGRGV